MHIGDDGLDVRCSGSRAVLSEKSVASHLAEKCKREDYWAPFRPGSDPTDSLLVCTFEDFVPVAQAEGMLLFCQNWVVMKKCLWSNAVTACESSTSSTRAILLRNKPVSSVDLSTGLPNRVLHLRKEPQ